jgi:hypothetical protein
MAAILLGMSLSSRAYLFIAGHHPILAEIDPVFFAIEIVVAAGMIAVALRANRIYPLWMAGFQIIAVFAHFARGLSDAVSPLAYIVLTVGPSYFQIIILGFGIWFHHRRVKRHGSYRSWRTSSPHSPEPPRRN